MTPELTDPRLFIDARHEIPVLIGLDPAVAVVFSAACPGGTGPNEDSAAVVPASAGRLLLAVADGAGGPPSGEEASRIAVEQVANTVKRASEDEALRVAILDGIEHANEEIRALKVGAATTLAALEVDDGSVRPYHVGDSTILVVGQRGKRKLTTVSHSPVGYGVEAGLIDESEALHHDELNVVSNFVGAEDMRVEVGAVLALDERDTVVLGTDGLFDNVHVDEIVALVQSGPLDEAAAKLAETCLSRMLEPEEGKPSKVDDVTFILYRGWSSPT